MTTEQTFLALGSVVILKGALKKLMIVNRASIVEGRYFDYGAVLFPEGMIDANLAYFNHEDILKVVSEGHRDDEDALMVEQITEAKEEYIAKPQEQLETTVLSEVMTIPEDPFAAVQDMKD